MPRDSNISQSSRSSSASGSRSGKAAKISPVVMNPRSLTWASTSPTCDDAALACASSDEASTTSAPDGATDSALASSGVSGSGVSIISDPRYQLLGDVLRDIPMLQRPRVCERVEHRFDVGTTRVLTPQHRREKTLT